MQPLIHHVMDSLSDLRSVCLEYLVKRNAIHVLEDHTDLSEVLASLALLGIESSDIIAVLFKGKFI